ncbi:MAG TPA: GNAT family N-acetyltransferase, partial [Candidatus Ozemobacteraceae bacterium]|nr:GNAT family N-acetyltransferase [Candidatus Ozemobacteraceae bacterium]
PTLSPRFAGDDAPGTIHLAAYMDQELAGCVTFIRSPFEGRPAFQVRGMAVDTGCQGYGIGRALLAAAEKVVGQDEASHLWWCNARASAVGFYQKLGWQVVSEEFDVPGIGPHARMICRF